MLNEDRLVILTTKSFETIRFHKVMNRICGAHATDGLQKDLIFTLHFCKHLAKL